MCGVIVRVPWADMESVFLNQVQVIHLCGAVFAMVRTVLAMKVI